MRRNPFLRFLRWIVAALVAAPVFYVATAFAFALLAQSRPVQTDGIRIYACDNGVHADLVLPVAAAGVDWRQIFTAGAFGGPVQQFDHIGIGWGSRDFYLNTPTWADVKVGTALKSLLWDETVLRVDFRPAPILEEDCREWRVDQTDYGRIATFVRDSLRLSQGLPVRAADGYGPRDAFFVANGRYTIIETCNQWTGRALGAGGAPMAPWTPFSFLVLWNLPPVAP